MLNITSASEYEAAKLSHPKLVVHFWAEWCEPCSQLDKVLELAIEEFKENNNGSDSVTCARVEAEQVVDVSEKCKVTVVPLFIFYSGGKELDRLEGADAAGLHAKFMALASGQSSTAKPVPTAQPPTEVVPLQQRLERLVRQQPVMLFMKGELTERQRDRLIDWLSEG